DAHAAVVAEIPDVRVVHRSSDADLDRALGIEQTFLDRAAEGCPVMELGAEVVVPGVTMGVEMHHADGALLGDAAHHRERHRMAAACGDRHHARGMKSPVEGSDLVERARELKGLLDPGVADIADPAERIGIDPARLVHLAHQARLVTDLAGAVPRTWPVGDAAVERNPREADVDRREILGQGRAHECRYPEVPRSHHRIRELGIGIVSLHRVHRHTARVWPGAYARPSGITTAYSSPSCWGGEVR